MMKMPGIKMLEGSMMALEANYLITQGNRINVQVRIVRNVYEAGCMEIHIRDMVLHNFDKARSYLHRISDAELVDIPRADESEARS